MLHCRGVARGRGFFPTRPPSRDWGCRGHPYDPGGRFDLIPWPLLLARRRGDTYKGPSKGGVPPWNPHKGQGVPCTHNGVARWRVFSFPPARPRGVLGCRGHPYDPGGGVAPCTPIWKSGKGGRLAWTFRQKGCRCTSPGLALTSYSRFSVLSTLALLSLVCRLLLGGSGTGQPDGGPHTGAH